MDFYTSRSQLSSHFIENPMVQLGFCILQAKLCSWRAQALWSKFEKRASFRCYGRGKACYGSRV